MSARTKGIETVWTFFGHGSLFYRFYFWWTFSYPSWFDAAALRPN